MKKVSLVMTVLLMGLILSGCGQGSKESGTTTGTESSSSYSVASLRGGGIPPVPETYYLAGTAMYAVPPDLDPDPDGDGEPGGNGGDGGAFRSVLLSPAPSADVKYAALSCIEENDHDGHQEACEDPPVETQTNGSGFFRFAVSEDIPYRVMIDTCRDPDGVYRGNKWYGKYDYTQGPYKSARASGPTILLSNRGQSPGCEVEGVDPIDPE